MASPACGLNDDSTAGMWRLPSIRELRTLVDIGWANPYLPQGHPFADVRFADVRSVYYWSSSTYALLPANAWYVDFNDGYAGAGSKTSTGAGVVWPVRGGQ